MHASKLLVTTFVVMLAFSAPASAEPGWLSKWKTFVDEHILVDTTTDEQQAAPREASNAEETQSTVPPRVPQSGNPGDFRLAGKWVLRGRNGGGELGSLHAGSKFFTLDLKDPTVEFRTAYVQAPNGGFRCTVLDKQVVTIEGRFQDRDRIDFQVQIKEIGRPKVKRYRMVADRQD